MVPLVSTMLADISVFVLRGTLDNTVIEVHIFISSMAFSVCFPYVEIKYLGNNGINLKFHP